MYSMRCPKCGVIQSLNETCKNCGAKVEGPSSGLPSHQPTIRSQSSQARPPGRTGSEENDPIPLETDVDPSQIYQLSFYGTGGSLFGIIIVNIFLTIITFGIYSFWGRTKVRKYLMSQTELEGDRFAYHGTGKELLIGFLKILPLFIFIVLLNSLPAILGLGETVEAIANLLTFVIVFFVLFPVAIVGMLRYRLSRTSWRGIRFSLRGPVMDFIKLNAMGWILSLLTLGVYYHIFSIKQYEYLVSHSYFGNQKLHFDGRRTDLLSSYLLALLLTIPTLGFYWFWFSAKLLRHLLSHTSFGTARFSSTITGGRFLLFHLGNLLLVIVTLGIAGPWVMVRIIRFAFTHITLQGPLDLASIVQEAELAPATGEGLAGFLDLDVGL